MVSSTNKYMHSWKPVLNGFNIFSVYQKTAKTIWTIVAEVRPSVCLSVCPSVRQPEKYKNLQ